MGWHLLGRLGTVVVIRVVRGLLSLLSRRRVIKLAQKRNEKVLYPILNGVKIIGARLIMQQGLLKSPKRRRKLRQRVKVVK